MGLENQVDGAKSQIDGVIRPTITKSSTRSQAPGGGGGFQGAVAKHAVGHLLIDRERAAGLTLADVLRSQSQPTAP